MLSAALTVSRAAGPKETGLRKQSCPVSAVVASRVAWVSSPHEEVLFAVIPALLPAPPGLRLTAASGRHPDLQRDSQALSISQLLSQEPTLKPALDHQQPQRN